MEKSIEELTSEELLSMDSKELADKMFDKASLDDVEEWCEAGRPGDDIRFTVAGQPDNSPYIIVYDSFVNNPKSNEECREIVYSIFKNVMNWKKQNEMA